MIFKEIQNCRVAGGKTSILWNLGNFYLSHFYDTLNKNAAQAPLSISIGKESNLLQLTHSVNRDEMYRTYWYRSGTNETMTLQLKDIVNCINNWVKLNDGDIVLDIGCNDGTLLNHFDNRIKLKKIGIDPAKNIQPAESVNIDKFLCDYFTSDKYLNLSDGKKAKVITSIAMFYDLEDPNKFANDIYKSLTDDGIWILQLSYTPLMLIQNAFDNIIHEHLEYYTLESIKYILDKNNFKILDVELNNTNAGSIRVIASKKTKNLDYVPIFNLDIGNLRLNTLSNYEKSNFPDIEKSFIEFKNRVELIKNKTLEKLSELKSKKKKVIGYGASTKGNTLLQYYGLDNDLIDYICERQSQKYNKLTPGSWIEIISEDKMRKINPDYLFVLPWHFASEFLQREKSLLSNGTKIILPLPELKIFGD